MSWISRPKASSENRPTAVHTFSLHGSGAEHRLSLNCLLETSSWRLVATQAAVASWVTGFSGLQLSVWFREKRDLLRFLPRSPSDFPQMELLTGFHGASRWKPDSRWITSSRRITSGWSEMARRWHLEWFKLQSQLQQRHKQPRQCLAAKQAMSQGHGGNCCQSPRFLTTAPGRVKFLLGRNGVCPSSNT